MKNIIVILIIFLVTFVNLGAQTQNAEVFRQEGIASWYGREFDGRPTASGEIFDSSQLTAAHPALPFGTKLTVTNMHNNKSVTVRVNDRGPFIPLRIVDVSRAAAGQLDMIVTGTAPVRIESVNAVVWQNPPVNAQPQAAAQVIFPQVITNAPVAVAPVVTTPVVTAPVVPALSTPALRLFPSINIVPDKTYRLQVGSYRIDRNAIDTFNRLKNSGFNPAHERFTDNNNIDFYRVVLAGIPGTDVLSLSQRLSAAGFREALIREEI